MMKRRLVLCATPLAGGTSTQGNPRVETFPDFTCKRATSAGHIPLPAVPTTGAAK